MKSGNLNFLELSGPLQACNGTDLPLPIEIYYDARPYERQISKRLVENNLTTNFIPYKKKKTYYF